MNWMEWPYFWASHDASPTSHPAAFPSDRVLEEAEQRHTNPKEAPAVAAPVEMPPIAAGFHGLPRARPIRPGE